MKKTRASLKLFYRCLMSMVHKKMPKTRRHLHPLSLEPISRLVGYDSTPRNISFSLSTNIEAPLKVIELLGINIYTDLLFDTDVLLTIAGRLEMNSWEDFQEMYDGSRMSVTGVNCSYSLFNHSCQPNVTCFRDASTGKIVVQAIREIRAGEELYLSYLDADALAEGRKARLEMPENWMGTRPHHCALCYPARADIVPQSSSSGNKRSRPVEVVEISSDEEGPIIPSAPKKRRKWKRVDDSPISENVEKRLKKAKLEESHEETEFQELPPDYDSADEYSSSDHEGVDNKQSSEEDSESEEDEDDEY